jgi:hypothetical protein
VTAAHKVAAKHFFNVAREASAILDKPSLWALTFTIRMYLVREEKKKESRLRAGAKRRMTATSEVPKSLPDTGAPPEDPG